MNMYTEKEVIGLVNFILRKYGVKYEDHPHITDSEGNPMSGPATCTGPDIANYRDESGVTPLMPGQSIEIHTVQGNIIYAEINKIEDSASIAE